MKKILVIPHHPGNSKIKIRLIEVAKALAKSHIVYLMHWHAAFDSYSFIKRVNLAIKDFFLPETTYSCGNLKIVSQRILHRPLAFAPHFNWLRLEKILEKEKIEVVINGSYYLFGISQKKWVFKYILDLADLPILEDQSHFDNFVDRHLTKEFKKADSIVVISEGLKQHLQKKYGKDSTVIPNGVDIKKMRSVKKEEVIRIRQKLKLDEKWVIGYIGFIGDWVNVELVVSAFKEIKEKFKDAFLLWIGMSPNLYQLKKRFQDQDIFFTGGVKEDIEPYFHALDVGIIPHRVSLFQDLAFHIKILEYTAAEKIIISHPMKETIRLGFPNIIFAEEKKQSWIESMLKARSLEWQKNWSSLVEDYDWYNIAQKFSILF